MIMHDLLLLPLVMALATLLVGMLMGRALRIRL
jgi:hypothetical protein